MDKFKPITMTDEILVGVLHELRALSAVLVKLVPKEETGEIRTIKETKSGRSRKAQKTDTDGT